MIKSLKYAAAAAVAALAPVSASALTFSGTLSDGDTFAFSDGTGSLGAIAFTSEGPGSITLNILNDVGANLRLAFDTLFNSLTGATFTLDGNAVSPDFGASIASGTTSELVISYGSLAPGANISSTLAAVPVPAAAALMLTALGGLALARLRKQA